MTKKAVPLAERFWASVTGAQNAGCWLWVGYIKQNGYGQISRGGRHGKLDYAHRVSWELHNGPIPDGLDICHSCDNPPCVNPAHLFSGTRADNVADMVRKGRQSKGPGFLGEQQWNSKLTSEAVAMIRAASKGPNGYTKSDLVALSRIHGVSPVTVGKVLYRQSWKHV